MKRSVIYSKMKQIMVFSLQGAGDIGNVLQIDIRRDIQMKKRLLKTAAVVLSLLMVLAMFSACGSDKGAEASVDEIVDAAVKAALDASASAVTVTIEADGQQITVEDTEGKSVAMLLEQAGIVLNEGDVVSVSPNQLFAGNITVSVLRKNAVTVVVTSEASQETRHAAVLMGGTVADALAALGLELGEDQVMELELTQALENGMEIVISQKEQVPEATEPENSNSDYDYNSGSSSNSSSGSSAGSGSDAGSDSDSDSGSSNERYVVSVVYYEDCDGSGHGVKVITYSDGTQEEVPY